jgi:hypothetical protein
MKYFLLIENPGERRFESGVSSFEQESTGQRDGDVGGDAAALDGVAAERDIIRGRKLETIAGGQKFD